MKAESTLWASCSVMASGVRSGATTSAATRRTAPPAEASGWKTTASCTPGIASRRRVRSASEARLPATSIMSALRPRMMKRLPGWQLDEVLQAHGRGEPRRVHRHAFGIGLQR